LAQVQVLSSSHRLLLIAILPDSAFAHVRPRDDAWGRFKPPTKPKPKARDDDAVPDEVGSDMRLRDSYAIDRFITSRLGPKCRKHCNW